MIHGPNGASREIALMRSNGFPKVERRKSNDINELKLDIVMKEIKNPALKEMAQSMLKLDYDVNNGEIDGENARIRFGVMKEMLRIVALDMAMRAK